MPLNARSECVAPSDLPVGAVVETMRMFQAAWPASHQPAFRPTRGSGDGAVAETIGATGFGITDGGGGGGGGGGPPRPPRPAPAAGGRERIFGRAAAGGVAAGVAGAAAAAGVGVTAGGCGRRSRRRSGGGVGGSPPAAPWYSTNWRMRRRTPHLRRGAAAIDSLAICGRHNSDLTHSGRPPPSSIFCITLISIVWSAWTSLANLNTVSSCAAP